MCPLNPNGGFPMTTYFKDVSGGVQPRKSNLDTPSHLGSMSIPIFLCDNALKKLPSPADGSMNVYSSGFTPVTRKNVSMHFFAMPCGVKN